MRVPFTSPVLALTFATGLLTAQDTREAKIAWLREHVATSLTGLAEIIGDAEVVFLGEATHGDGTTFERKVEICQHLHRKCGFSVLVFESGMYDCHKAWREIAAGRDPGAAARDAVFTVWSKSAQVAPLWRYLGEQSRTKRPLELAGFDFQPSGVHTKNELLPEIVAALKKHAAELVGTKVFSEFSSPYELMRDGKFGPLRAVDAAGREAFAKSSAKIAEALTPDAPLLAQATRSHAMYMRFVWGLARQTPPEVFNLREEQGAANFAWMRENLYKGRKIIVWGATSHLSRNRQKIETDNAPGMIPFGHHVAKQLGDKLFILGFDAHHGEAGVGREGGPKFAIQAAPEDSFADLLHGAGRGGGFVDLRAADWLQKKRIARLMGHSPMRADWSQVVDAICFVPEMKRSDPDGKDED